jgi:hypothetical protein
LDAVYLLLCAALSWSLDWRAIPGPPLPPLGIALVVLAFIPTVWAFVLVRREDTEIEPTSPVDNGDTIRFLSLSWVITLIDHRSCAIAGGFLGLLLRLHRHDHFLDTSHCIRPLSTKALEIKLPNELPQRQLPWLLVMVVQLPELFWVHPKFTCHLHVLMRQVKPAPRVDPRLQACRYPFLILLRHSGVPRSGSVFASKWRLYPMTAASICAGRSALTVSTTTLSLWQTSAYLLHTLFVRRSALKSIGKFLSGKVGGSGACV